MLRPTVLMHAAVASQILPPLAGLIGRRLADPARRWVVVWCLLFVLHDGLSLALGLRGINNLWLGYVLTPLGGVVALWMLSHWQLHATARLALRLAIPIMLAVGGILFLAFEDASEFSRFTSTFLWLVLLLASLWTFFHRSFAETERLVQLDWFWIVLGLILHAASSTAIEPLSGYFLAVERVDLIFLAINAKAGVDLVAFVIIAWGVSCPLTSSGGVS